MAINWIPPINAPANVVATVQSGGTLPMDTYYVRICAATTEDYGIADSTHRRGAPSTEISFVTTSGNQTVNLTWDSVTDATYYNVYITTDSSGNNRWVRKRVARLSDGSYLRATTNLIDITLDSTALFNNVDFDTFSYSMNNKFEGNLDRNFGNGNIIISGSVGTMTLDSITAVLDAAGASAYYFWDGNYFVLKGNICIEAGTVGAMTLNKIHLINIQASIYNLSSSFTLTMEYCKVDLDGWSNRYNKFGYATYKRNYFTSSANPGQGVVKNGDLRVAFSDNHIDGGGNIFIPYLYIYNRTSTIKDAISFSSVVPFSMDVTLEDVNFFGVILNAESNSNALVTIRRGRVDGGSAYTYHIRFRDLKNYPTKFIDIDFTKAGLVSDNTRPLVYWSSANAYNNILDIYFSFNTLIVDTGGNPIQNATIILTDKNGSEIVSLTTDVNGKITEQEVLTTRITHKTGSGIGAGLNYTDYEDSSPFTLKIKKAGYQTYKSVFTMQECKDLVISLKHSNVCVDQEVMLS